MKRHRFQQIVWFFFDNGPIVFTVIFASYVAARAQIEAVEESTLLSWILAVLGLLAVSELVERLRILHRMESTTLKLLKEVESNVTQPRISQFLLFRLPSASVESSFSNVQTVYLAGINLQRFTREYSDKLAERLDKGGSIKVIVLDPNGKAVGRVLKKEANITLENLKANIQLTLQRLRWLGQRSENQGKLEVRLAEEILHFSLVIFDPYEESGVMFVEFYPQRWSFEGRPRLKIEALQDSKWFQYFVKQFESLWGDSRPLDIETPPAPDAHH